MPQRAIERVPSELLFRVDRKHLPVKEEASVRLRHSVPPLAIRRELGDLVPVWPRGSVARAAKA